MNQQPNRTVVPCNFVELLLSAFYHRTVARRNLVDLFA